MVLEEEEEEGGRAEKMGEEYGCGSGVWRLEGAKSHQRLIKVDRSEGNDHPR